MNHRYHVYISPTLALAPLESEHLSLTLEWRNDTDSRRWFRNSQLITLEMHNSWFTSYLQTENNIMFVLLDENLPVGQLGIYEIDNNTKSAEIGRFLISPSSRGQGKIQIAIRSLVDFARDILHLNYLTLEVKDSNYPALHIYNKLGFKVAPNGDNGYISMRKILSA